METTLLEQFKFLIKENKGISLEKVIEQILESSLLFVNELFRMTNIQELNNPPNGNKHYNTFLLFTKQNYLDYKKTKHSFIQLSDKMIQKLKLLTILDIAATNKSVSYGHLMNELEISDQFELDYLLFESVSLGIIQGKVDQRARTFKILSIKGRDFISDYGEVNNKIGKWIQNLEKTERLIDKQIEEIRMNTLAFNENIKNLTVSGIYILLLALAQDIQGITLDTTNTMQVDNK